MQHGLKVTELGCLNIMNDVVVDIVVILLAYLRLKFRYVISQLEVQDSSVYGEGSSD